MTESSRTFRKQSAPAAIRNSGPILEVLRECLPASGRALEIASGTGQHAVAFATAFPAIDWQPSDPSAGARESIAAWVDEAGLGNLHPPLNLDVTQPGWERAIRSGFDVVVCINMIHIAPWAACVGLMQGAGNLLRRQGILFLYGPYMRNGVHTAPTNEAFDHSLRAQDPAWGVRGMEAVIELAAGNGLAHRRTVAMPANNFSLLFEKV